MPLTGMPTGFLVLYLLHASELQLVTIAVGTLGRQLYATWNKA